MQLFLINTQKTEYFDNLDPIRLVLIPNLEFRCLAGEKIKEKIA